MSMAARWDEPSDHATADRFPTDGPNSSRSLISNPGDIVVTKRTWGAFASTDLESQLKARGVTQVVVNGVATGTGIYGAADL